MSIRYNDKGKIIPHRFSVKKLERADQDNIGFCLACGASRDCCEPDARRYKCEECNKNYVYGAAELALMGYVK